MGTKLQQILGTVILAICSSSCTLTGTKNVGLYFAGTGEQLFNELYKKNKWNIWANCANYNYSLTWINAIKGDDVLVLTISRTRENSECSKASNKSWSWLCLLSAARACSSAAAGWVRAGLKNNTLRCYQTWRAGTCTIYTWFSYWNHHFQWLLEGR